MAEASVEMREKVILVALQCFAAHGFDGTALQKIAEEVGVTKAAVLHHFSSKEGLRQAVLDSMLSHWREALPRLLRAATAATNRFDAVFGELYRFFSTDPRRARLLLRETMDRPEETKRLLREEIRPWLDTIAVYIHEGKASGRHHPDVDPEAYVFLILQSVLLATSSGPLATEVIGPKAEERQAREIARIAKTSLFQPLASVPLASSVPSASSVSSKPRSSSGASEPSVSPEPSTLPSSATPSKAKKERP